MTETTEPNREKRHIVICCDGTGNEISDNLSNVLKLYRTLRKTEKTHPNQLVFYDPGVGTLERPDPFHRFKQNFNLVIGLAFGYGLDDNVLASYQFIVENHGEGDDIYLFGFSRGAYTVRVLAALIHKIGLISLPQNNLAGSGLTAYKQFSTDKVAPDQKDDPAAQYARILSVKWPTVKFVGVWDTVASVIVPRWDRINPAKLQFSPWSLEELAFIRENPSIEIFRQAISIDERRRMFRPQPWDAGKFRPHRYAPESTWKDQDSVQVWFAGVHSDVGGGYPEAESALSKYPLLWMIEEAVKHGLKVDRRTVNQLGWGRKRKNSPFDYVAPDYLPYPGNPASRDWQPHDSMNAGWRVLEAFPKKDKYKEWPERKSMFGYYIPCSEPRLIPEGALIHQSVLDKIAQDKTYRPVNMPARYTPVPMETPPAPGSADDAVEDDGVGA